ncbi:RNA polymerase sigma factor [Lutispora saccharofermentans]|uniref:RNA polymerase sigma factor n=1 Tax=Lutispora saccharofermentans TaxID=3024236 RepID=A0ABT1NG16_9FIRM|nr:RNA polymerase sigma factor [Lutispora saccharofermentans]MCQ1528796.1 RNA polymerase sigma factor [Lutispora saccharofermentans]
MSIYLAMIESSDDKSKFEQIYINYRQTMFYVANSILKDEHLAEDAVHQAFIKIIENLDKINEIKCPKTKGFIVIIVERTAIDIYRKRRRQYTIPFDEVIFGAEEMAAGADRSFEEVGNSSIAAAIAMLPINYSSAIKLKYSHGYTDKEIAKILSISEENVRKRIARGKKRLAKILEEMEINIYD